MRINNPRNMNNEELLSRVYIDDNFFVGDGSEDNELKFANGYNKDYTAFEVFAHDYDIPVGECEELGGYVTNAIPPNRIHKFKIRSGQLPEKQNVIIDWGDDTSTNLSELTVSGSDGNYRYDLSHEYQNNGKYIIRIYGNTYFGFDQVNNYNLVCRSLDNDLPVASHIDNFSSYLKYATRLLNINVFNSNFNSQYSNISNMFYNCKNLLSAIGFSIRNKTYITPQSAFYGCSSLVKCDLTCSSIDTKLGGVFNKCKSLKMDVNYYFSTINFFSMDSVSLGNLFNGCINLYGNVPANKLWNNKYIIWSNTSNVFSGCSAEIRSQVPKSWGGTASDDIINNTN